MKKYKVDNLNSKTSQTEKGKLVDALRGVTGVEKAILHPASSELEISPSQSGQPKRAELATAVKKAGFVLREE